ncbi:MAG: 2'-5' RNA ligase family protein [Planctomycetes bacterium]|nr:2'-5' RNA ligase family protein [Planctomycetota bacterium]
MGYIVLLTFDENTNIAIEAIPFFDNKGLVTTVPHVSLVTGRGSIDSELADRITSVMNAYKQIKMIFRSVGLFQESGTMFWNPVPSMPLMEMQRDVTRLLLKHGIDFPETYKEDCWMPHCTLSVGSIEAGMNIAESYHMIPRYMDVRAVKWGINTLDGEEASVYGGSLSEA